ncbi:MAG: amidohydrolase [Sediminibacterium sp.]|nr:amidohydrolase [Sediminibacterium sp.]
MNISLVQTDLIWESPAENYRQMERLLVPLQAGQTDVIVLPEMFTTGFTMQPERLAEAVEQELTLKWLRVTAAAKQAVITGSVAVNENGNYYNRLFWVLPDGTYHAYNKRHLFRMGQEHLHYTAGAQRLITTWKHFQFCPQICYDLRFPVWSRNRFQKTESQQVQAEYDVLLYVANWPEVRRYPWRQLLIARAIENQCYVIGVNRCGKDGNGVNHSGDSLIVDPRGEILLEAPEYQSGVFTATLQKTHLDDFRKAFPAGLDADTFDIAL